MTLDAEVVESAGLLGDWYSNSFAVGRRRFVLCISSETLLPIIMPLRRSDIPTRFPENLRIVLQGIGISAADIESVVNALGSSVFATTRNRSLIGTLNEFIHCGTIYLERGESMEEAALRLAEMPCGFLYHRCPRDMTRLIFASSNEPST